MPVTGADVRRPGFLWWPAVLCCSSRKTPGGADEGF